MLGTHHATRRQKVWGTGRQSWNSTRFQTRPRQVQGLFVFVSFFVCFFTNTEPFTASAPTGWRHLAHVRFSLPSNNILITTRLWTQIQHQAQNVICNARRRVLVVTRLKSYQNFEIYSNKHLRFVRSFSSLSCTCLDLVESEHIFLLQWKRVESNLQPKW